jgi:8-oxo-dGTP diphosphatase
MPNGKPGSKLIRAAGGVAWRAGPDGEPEILLVHRTRYDDWSLPKGKIEPGELLPVTAVREVLEEGGARLALGRRLISIRYHVGGRPKRVHYWAARVVSLDDRAVPNAEVDQIKWVGAAHAVEHVSYAHDHGVLADFTRLPAQTVPVILLRHAKAMHKSSWSRADSRRPIDDSGRADAKALAELLGCFASRARLITSPAVRCVETLRPFAELTGAQLREEPSLYAHHQLATPDPADARLSVTALVSEAIAAGEPTIICAHRENLPDLQAAALAALGIAAPGSDAAPGSALAGEALAPIAEVPKDWADALPTAGFWVLNLARAPAPAPPFPPDPSALLAAPTSAVSPPPPADLPPPAHSPSRVPLPSAAPVRRRWFAFRRPFRNVVPATEAPAASAPPVPETTQPPRPAAPRLISADRYDLTEP